MSLTFRTIFIVLLVVFTSRGMMVPGVGVLGYLIEVLFRARKRFM